MHLRIEPSTEHWPTATARRPVWTGHQATLFHPGILAKYEAAAAAARSAGRGVSAGRVGGAQVLVDQDVYDPLSLAVPVRDGPRLGVQRVSLGDGAAGGGGEGDGHAASAVGVGGGGVPVGMRPPVRTDRVAAGLKRWPASATFKPDVARWLSAFDEARRESETLARQMEGVLMRLLPGGAMSDRPGEAVYGGGVAASGLLARESALLHELLHDAANCAAHYNAAVSDHPSAGVSWLTVLPDRVEVPLWALRWMKPRRRVHVDLADTEPIFVTDDGEPLGEDVTLAPRALLMTAMLRRPDRCAVFIHGTGGGSYDRITEAWWRNWRTSLPASVSDGGGGKGGQGGVGGAGGAGKLAPMAVVTADLRLEFEGVAVNDARRVAEAVWHRHHLPHNVDRALGLDPQHPTVRAKRELLASMDQDRDRARRRSAFALLHRLNEELVGEHPGAIAEAESAVGRARDGLANARVAGRRDWSCLLYSVEALGRLREAVAERFRPREVSVGGGGG